MKEKIHIINKNNTWDLIILSEDHQAISVKRISKIKKHTQGR